MCACHCAQLSYTFSTEEFWKLSLITSRQKSYRSDVVYCWWEISKWICTAQLSSRSSNATNEMVTGNDQTADVVRSSMKTSRSSLFYRQSSGVWRGQKVTDGQTDRHAGRSTAMAAAILLVKRYMQQCSRRRHTRSTAQQAVGITHTHCSRRAAVDNSCV